MSTHSPPVDLLTELRLTLILADAEQVVVQRADGLYGALWAIPGQWNALVCTTADEAMDPHAAPSVGWHHYLAAATSEDALRAVAAWSEHGVDTLGALRRQGRTRADGWVQVAGWQPAPPIENVVGAPWRITRVLYEELRDGINTHWFEGKACRGVSADDSVPMLAVGMVLGPTQTPTYRVASTLFTARGIGGTPSWETVEVELVDEPDVLDLPRSMLVAMAAYAVDWPGSAQRVHWLAPVPAITRIRYAAILATGAADDEAWYLASGEDVDDGGWNDLLASVGDVTARESWRATWEAIRAKWPALSRKYGCDAALNHCSAGMTDRPI